MPLPRLVKSLNRSTPLTWLWRKLKWRSWHGKVKALLRWVFHYSTTLTAETHTVWCPYMNPCLPNCLWCLAHMSIWHNDLKLNQSLPHRESNKKKGFKVMLRRCRFLVTDFLIVRNLFETWFGQHGLGSFSWLTDNSAATCLRDGCVCGCACIGMFALK